MYELLDTIDSPADIRSFSIDQLRQLCSELRSYIIECCAVNPGHLASSLGSVEMIVGMHYVFNTPKDSIVFDVGHQAYAHKILTGRREAFKRLRRKDGVSGFPKRSESPYDSFGAGHSSTSISAALGLTYAAKMQKRSDKVIAFIGDGAMTGGLAFEGLNNAGIAGSDLLIILNDNNQSIDNNLGALHEHLIKFSTSASYNHFKTNIWNLLGDGSVRHFLQRWVRSFKSWLVKKSGGDIFESLGFRYFGPIDGNDIEEVVHYLRKIQSLGGPRLLHCISVKGKGYTAAEADPITWHAPGRFDPSTGKRVSSPHTKSRYQDVFGRVLCELAKMDEKVVGITPAMAQGCGMNMLAAEMPERFFDVGIEEEHAVTFSAGLAAGGMKPFCNIYSSFAQRAYDQIIHDVALQELPVVLCFDRAGLVGEDGATHHGVFDIAAYRSIPGAIIASPRNEIELKNLMYSAYLSQDEQQDRAKGCPYIIRYPRGMGEGCDWQSAQFEAIEAGSAEVLKEGNLLAIIATGPVANRAMEAVAELGEDGSKVGVYNFRFVKPLDDKTLSEISSRYTHILTLEDGCLLGGLYGAVCEWKEAKGQRIAVSGVGIPDQFIHQDSQASQLAACGLDRDSILSKIREIISSS